jgi:hypothetical protein
MLASSLWVVGLLSLPPQDEVIGPDSHDGGTLLPNDKIAPAPTELPASVIASSGESVPKRSTVWHKRSAPPQDVQSADGDGDIFWVIKNATGATSTVFSAHTRHAPSMPPSMPPLPPPAPPASPPPPITSSPLFYVGAVVVGAIVAICFCLGRSQRG